MASLVAYAAYVPFWRLPRSDIAAFLATRGGRGGRAVASWDEDTTTMGVEAARLAIRPRAATSRGRPLFFATSEPAYQSKTNAAAIHAALDLDPSAGAFDLTGGSRAGVGALVSAARLGGTAVVSDMRNGPAGSADEALGGDGAAAFAFGDDRPVAELVGVAHVTREYMERWRLPGDASARTADQRFIEHVQERLVDSAVAEALKDADISQAEVDQVLVASQSGRTRAAAARALGRTTDEAGDELAERIGYAGAAHWALMLADALDGSDPDQHIVVVALGEGVSTLVFRTTSGLPAYREERAALGVATLADQLGRGGTVSYARFLTWRGSLDVDQPPRPHPQPFSPAAAERNARWKFALVADEERPLADEIATVVEVTVDRAADHPAASSAIAVIEFPGSARRVTVEIADADPPDSVRVGDQVAMTFRRLRTTDGVHDYFWKARPAGLGWRP